MEIIFLSYSCRNPFDSRNIILRTTHNLKIPFLSWAWIPTKQEFFFLHTVEWKLNAHVGMDPVIFQVQTSFKKIKNRG